MTDAETITRRLEGQWYGHYGSACCPAHCDKAPSLSLSDGADGRLLLYCHAGCDFQSILEALTSIGLTAPGGQSPKSDAAVRDPRQVAPPVDAARREARARACWREASPICGTPAEAYLRSRGITCELPTSLRFHPACPHPGMQRVPALVARIDGCERFAVHRTYLQTDGSGKAQIEPAKAMLGAVAGGAVRLAEACGPLLVTEGIETALSLASGLFRDPATIWAALSTSGMRSLRLPATPGQLIVATDGDEPGREAGYALAERAQVMGWSVSLLPAPDRQDWNDILVRKGATA